MDDKQTEVLSDKSPKVALVGNPNVGKSVIFGFLTGRYVTVSNYPGTTVEVTRGVADIEGQKVALIDTPGVNSLVPMSEDEQVTRNILLHEKVDSIVQVADAKNLRRALLISVQLIEMGLPFLLTLNMEDEAASLGMEIDKNKLSEILQLPVTGAIAIQKKGLKEIRKKIFSSKVSPNQMRYSPDIEAVADKIEKLLPTAPISRRSLALMVLSGDKSLFDWLHAKLSDEVIRQIDHIRGELSGKFHEPLAYVINKQRMKWVESILEKVVIKEAGARSGLLAWIGSVSMHPVWGLFFMLAVLVIVYYFVGYFGAQTAVGWLENGLFNTYINPWAKTFFAKIFYFSPFLQDIIVGPYGVLTMALTYSLAIIFPIVITFFIAFSIMEDSGYLPRLAIMLNRIFRMMGLNGKAVVPMVLGLGCDTMATMTARIMDTKKERIILTLLLALGVPCSAQLGIVLGMLGALPLWATFLWFGVVGGALVLVGFLASQIMPGQRSDFMMEIPPIRKPTGLNILTKTFARLEWYLIEVVPLFVVGTLVLFFLDRFKVLPVIQRAAAPLVVNFLHLPVEATEAFLIGFLRRDYGATHFFDLFREGKLDAIQAIVSLIVMTLFVPCLANTLMILKERGLKTMIAIVGFIYPFAFLVGGIINWGLRL
ncbi:MAG: ferrous iron transport protein B [Deltaproteobacteria bacterium]|nr:MAG: ferrous iron transport protein B [Deltaproteobacteria bacterium]